MVDKPDKLKERGQLIAVVVALALAMAADAAAIVLDQWFEAHTTGSIIQFGLAEACYIGGNGTCHDIATITEQAPSVHFCPPTSVTSDDGSSSSSVRTGAIEVSKDEVTGRTLAIFVLSIVSACLTGVALVSVALVALRGKRPRKPILLVLAPMFAVFTNGAVVVLSVDTFSSWLFCGRRYCDLIDALRVEALGHTNESCSTNYRLSFILSAVSLFMAATGLLMIFVAVVQIIWRRRVAIDKLQREGDDAAGPYDSIGGVSHKYYTGGHTTANRRYLKAPPPTATTMSSLGIEYHGQPDSNGISRSTSGGGAVTLRSDSERDGDEPREEDGVRDPFGTSEAQPAPHNGRGGQRHQRSHTRTSSQGSASSNQQRRKAHNWREHRRTPSANSTGSAAVDAEATRAPNDAFSPRGNISVPPPPPVQQQQAAGAPNRRHPPAALAPGQLPLSGDWYLDPSCEMYYCSVTRLYFDTQLGRYYDVDTARWYDPHHPEKGWFMHIEPV